MGYNFNNEPYYFQTKGETHDNALINWAKSLDVSSIKGFGQYSKENLVKDLCDDGLVKVKTVENVWCTSALIRNNFMLLNVVKTISANISMDSLSKLFTFVMNYDGGTYISQFHGKTPQDALLKWAGGLDIKVVYNFGLQSKQIVLGTVAADCFCLSLLQGMKNMWNINIPVRGNPCIINIICTAPNG